MDKVLSKRVFRERGLPIVDYTWFRANEWSPVKQREVEQVCGFPCFVKPANLGSSVGVSKAHDAAELETAMLEVLREHAAARYGTDGYWIDAVRRRIPDHWHAHARPRGGFFGR
jgi:D-alanine-D-alanine ligase-like ATP-grasp enzyme